jgi:hypothetical protein
MVALDKNGKIWAAGFNGEERLGVGALERQNDRFLYPI